MRSDPDSGRPEVTLISAEKARKFQETLGFFEGPEKLVVYVNAEMSFVPFSVRAVCAIDWMLCP
jgi:hypothetical protein